MDAIDLVSDSEDSSFDGGENEVLYLRGPGIVGDDTFDPYCVFPHEVALSADQVEFLRDKVAHRVPRRPFYVFTVSEALTKKKSKMHFSKQYSKQILKPYVSGKGIWIPVYDSDNVQYTEVKMKMSKERKGKRAIITSGWRTVVERMGAGHIYVFSFRRRTIMGMRRLKLVIEEVE